MYVSVTEQLVSCPEQKQLVKEMCAYSSILLQYIAIKIYFGKNLFLPAKTILPVRFFHGKYRFFPPTGKNLPTLWANNSFQINCTSLQNLQTLQ